MIAVIAEYTYTGEIFPACHFLTSCYSDHKLSGFGESASEPVSGYIHTELLSSGQCGQETGGYSLGTKHQP